MHHIDVSSEPHSDSSSMSSSSQSPSSLETCSTPNAYTCSSSGSSNILHEMLVLPQPKEKKVGEERKL